MSKHSDIADQLGRSRMAAALGVGATAVSNAIVRERFPASWFLVLSSLCAQRGIDCPPGLFDMKPLDGSRCVDNFGKSQEIVSNAVTASPEGGVE